MKKAIIVFLLTVVLALGLTSCVDLFFPSEDYIYILEDDGTYSITGYLGNSRNITVPSAFHGVPVTSISDEAFSNCDSLENVKIPDSVTSIGYAAFAGCPNLENITVDKGNAKYKSINGDIYTKDEKTLVQYAIGKTDKNFTIPDNVTSIDVCALAGSSNLVNVTIPDSVTSIGYDAFNNCNSLKDVYYNGSVESWCNISFSSADSNPMCYGANLYFCSEFVTELVIPDSVTEIKDYAFNGCTSLTSIVIPDSVTSIGDFAFDGCSSLTSIDIPDSVTSIGDGAFYNCYSLTSIDIPDSVTGIGDSAFSGCSSLASIEIPDSVTSIGKHVFHDCTSLTSIVIPDSVTGIGDSAFSGCSSLASVVIPDGVTGIGKFAFSGCSSLTSVIIPDGVTVIRDYAFYNCENLKSIVMADNVTSIGDSAFSSCTSLASIVIPDGVTSIGSGAFHRCSSLTSIVIPEGVTSIGHDAFHGCSSLTSIIIPDRVTSIGYGAFWNCRSLTSVVIPDSVTSIGERAFCDCKSLTSVVIGDSVTSIGEEAFYNCYSLTGVVIPDSVTSIGIDAFYGCDKLVEVINKSSLNIVAGSKDYGRVAEHAIEVHSGNSKIANKDGYIFYTAGGVNYLFDYIGNDTELALPASYNGTNYEIYKYGFYGNNKITSIEIPSSVTSIGYAAFSGCNNLTDIVLPFVGAAKDEQSDTHFGYIFGASSYSENSDYVPSSLKTIIITGGTSIGDYAFYNCDRFTKIEIPDSITTIGDSAFSGCSYSAYNAYDNAYYLGNAVNPYLILVKAKNASITSCKVNDSNKIILGSSFSGCSNLVSIEIPDGVTSIGENAFSDCQKLVEVINKSDLSITKGSTDHGYIAYRAIEVHDGESKVANQNDFLFYTTYDGTNYLLAYIGDNVEFALPSSYNDEKYAIYSSAFADCNKLTGVVISDGVTVIGNYAFYNCENLKSVVIADSVTSIGDNAFSNCTSLASIVIPDGVTSIGEYAFYNCYSLTSIEIPVSVTNIGAYAFSGCKHLSYIKYRGNETQWLSISKGSGWNSGYYEYAEIIYNYTRW